MKILPVVLVLVLIAGGAWYLYNQEPEIKQSAKPNLLDKVRAGEAVLVDVRTSEEWAAGHVKEAILFDSRRIEQGELPEVPKDKPVYLYCRSGNRAGVAKVTLEQKGFLNVTNLGGLADMEDLGAEVVK